MVLSLQPGLFVDMRKPLFPETDLTVLHSPAFPKYPRSRKTEHNNRQHEPRIIGAGGGKRIQPVYKPLFDAMQAGKGSKLFHASSTNGSVSSITSSITPGKLRRIKSTASII
jgi:hypothetical protein